MSAPEDRWTLARVLALKSLPAFEHLEADDLSVLAECAEYRRYEDGQPLFDADSGPAEAHLVIAGAVREQRFGRPFRRIESYDLVAPMDLLAGCSGRASAHAEGAAATLAIERALLLDVLEENFDALLGTIGQLAATAIRTRQRLGARAGHPARADIGSPVVGELDLVGRIRALRASAAFGSSRLSTVGHLALDAEPVRAAAGSALWKAGDPAADGLLVISGRLSCESADGNQHFEVGAGQLVGLEDPLAGKPRWHAACNADAIEMHALRIDASSLIDILEDDPETAVAGLAAAARGVVELFDRLSRGATAPEPS